MTPKPLKGISRTVLAHIDKSGAVFLKITEGPPQDQATAPVLLSGTIRSSSMDAIAMIITAALSAPEGE